MPTNTPIPFLQLFTIIGITFLSAWARYFLMPGKDKKSDKQIVFGNILVGLVIGFLTRGKHFKEYEIYEIATGLFAFFGKEIVVLGYQALPLIGNVLLKYTVGFLANLNKNKQDDNRPDRLNN